MMASWVRQMEEVLQRWIQSQNQWWDEYFAVLRRGGLVKLDQADIDAVAVSGPAPVAASAPTASEKPASAPPKAAASARPEPMAEVVAEPPVAAFTAEPPAAVNDEPPPTARIVEAPVELPPDDLKLVSGIGPALEKKLNACGIFTYRQLAALGDEEIERIEAAIKSFGRIRRDDWVGQARRSICGSIRNRFNPFQSFQFLQRRVQRPSGYRSRPIDVRSCHRRRAGRPDSAGQPSDRAGLGAHPPRFQGGPVLHRRP